MAESPTIRRLVPADLDAYKTLRDAMLAAHPDAFTSDADAERGKSAQTYLPRLGLDRVQGGHFTLGAWQARQLQAVITCERNLRAKVRHMGHIVGMMVSPDARGKGLGRALLDACIAEARRADGLELLTLSVTTTNRAAVQLYERAGFTRYGRLPRAIKLGGSYFNKDLMALTL